MLSRVSPKYRYFVLFVSLIAYMLAATFLETGLARVLTDAVFLWVVLSGIVTVQRHRRVTVFSIILGVIAFLIFLWNHVTSYTNLFLVQEIVEILFLFVLIGSILGDVLRTKKVTLDTVYGASSSYMMMGLLWGAIFSLIEILSPGSFRGSESWTTDSLNHLNYFSFVTLTTLGYGDISPNSAPAAVFAMLEAIIGQLFLVILVARLVSLQVSHSQMKD